MKDDRQKCLEAGASDYLAKPVGSEQLLSMLRVWLHRHADPADDTDPGRRPDRVRASAEPGGTVTRTDRSRRYDGAGVRTEPSGPEEGRRHGARAARSTSCWWTTSRTTCSPWRRSWRRWA